MLLNFLFLSRRAPAISLLHYTRSLGQLVNSLVSLMDGMPLNAFTCLFIHHLPIRNIVFLYTSSWVSITLLCIKPVSSSPVIMGKKSRSSNNISSVNGYSLCKFNDQYLFFPVLAVPNFCVSTFVVQSISCTLPLRLHACSRYHVVLLFYKFCFRTLACKCFWSIRDYLLEIIHYLGS